MPSPNRTVTCRKRLLQVLDVGQDVGNDLLVDFPQRRQNGQGCRFHFHFSKERPASWNLTRMSQRTVSPGSGDLPYTKFETITAFNICAMIDANDDADYGVLILSRSAVHQFARTPIYDVHHATTYTNLRSLKAGFEHEPVSCNQERMHSLMSSSA